MHNNKGISCSSNQCGLPLSRWRAQDHSISKQNCRLYPILDLLIIGWEASLSPSTQIHLVQEYADATYISSCESSFGAFIRVFNSSARPYNLFDIQTILWWKPLYCSHIITSWPSICLIRYSETVILTYMKFGVIRRVFERVLIHKIVDSMSLSFSSHTAVQTSKKPQI